MSPDEEQRITECVGAILRRFGGSIHLTEDELIDAQLLFQDEDDGGVTIQILPDYIAIGEESAPAPRTYDDQELADLLKEMKKYEQPLKYESRQPSISGSGGKVYLDQPDGHRMEIATKTEWTLTTDPSV